MTDVQVWDPAQSNLTSADVQILARASAGMDHPDLGLSKKEQAELLAAARKKSDTWQQLAVESSAEDVCSWVKALTLAEGRLSGFALGPNSPVIVLIRHLKRRGVLPAELLRWVRAHTTNRFLPYGSLQDRL
ncbi:MAG: hypothetical protein J4F97_06110 [Pseudomonadales bacterium]|nr:hypothetical protein [Pseudomonadales bacterium]